MSQVLSKPEPQARLARLFHRWGVRPVETAANMLCAALREAGGCELLLAGAGFVATDLPSPTRQRYPNAEEFASITAVARQTADALRDALPHDRPTLCLGIDVRAACARSDAICHVGQFGVVLSP